MKAEKKYDHPGKELKIIGVIENHQPISFGEIVLKSRINKLTARKIIWDLLDAEVIEKIGAVKSTKYQLTEVKVCRTI